MRACFVASVGADRKGRRCSERAIAVSVAAQCMRAAALLALLRLFPPSQEFERRRVEKDQKYASLSEERDAKKRVLEELWAQLQGAHRDVSDVEAEFDRERKFFMEQLQELQSQLKLRRGTQERGAEGSGGRQMVPVGPWSRLALREAIIAAFIPPDEQSKVMVKAVWDEDAEEWLLGQVSERAENATSVKRPVSASGTRRPMSSFAKAQAAQGDQNPRFKSENILTLELDMPERTTYGERRGLAQAHVRSSVNSRLF